MTDAARAVIQQALEAAMTQWRSETDVIPSPMRLRELEIEHLAQALDAYAAEQNAVLRAALEKLYGIAAFDTIVGGKRLEREVATLLAEPKP